jgi:hypothetical protein
VPHLLAVVFLTLATPLFTQSSQPTPAPVPSAGAPTTSTAPSEPAPTPEPPAAEASKPTDDDRVDGRIFGVLPNYTTVKDRADVPAIRTPQLFRMAALSSFDPYVFPFVGFVAGLNQLEHQQASWGPGPGAYGKRYTTAFADNAVGNFLTTAVMPLALKQDPRYFQLGSGSLVHRIAYAASRSVITRSRTGQHAFNASEIGGNLLGSAVSNLYHPGEDRTFGDTIARAGTQVLWDTLANELKEFWPDIHRRLRRHQGS